SAGPEHLPPLVFFHGWGGNAAATCFELDLLLLTQHFRIYSPDTIGQSGRSAPNRPPTTGDAYGEWAVDVLDALAIDRTYVSGISGGGYLTLKLTSFAPKRVIKALPVSTAGLVSLMPPPLRFLLGAFPVGMWPNAANARRFINAATSPRVPRTTHHEDAAQFMQRLFKHYRFANGPSLISDQQLQRITSPTYVLMGCDDVACNPTKSIERAMRLIRGVQTELLPDAGHMLTLDHPGLVEQRMVAFFAD
ncbi:MAG: alpha/beta hydrolase, partial [Burkholderiales bacterium]|nr:alpha/beta hydrolase [Anaerolineae bacterium]